MTSPPPRPDASDQTPAPSADPKVLVADRAGAGVPDAAKIDTPTIDISEILAAAVTAVPGVAALHSGMFGEVGTYLPGRRVQGIRLDSGIVQVHIVLSYGVPVTEVAARIRAAVTTITGPGSVHVHIEDVLPRSGS